MSSSGRRFSFGFSRGEDGDHVKKESEVALVNEDRRKSTSSISRGGWSSEMEVQSENEDIEFWPLEHPMEPQNEDRPIKCPIPTSSSLMDSGRMHGKNATQRRWELATWMETKDEIVVASTDPRARALRKRQHTFTTHEDDRHVITITPARRSVNNPPLSRKNSRVFQMFQHLDD